MKKILLLTVLCMVVKVSAQETESSFTPETKMNIIKTNIPAFIFRNYNLGYERVINKWFSASASVSLMPKGNVPFISSYSLGNNSIENLSDIEVSNTAITIEPRFYVGKGFGKGFYFASYYRHTSYKMSNIQISVNNEMIGKTPVNIAGKVSANNFGLMIGAQWFLGQKKNWVIDWWIVGAHYGFSKGNFDGSLKNRILTERAQKELKKELENLDLPFVKYKVETNPRGAKIDVDGPWAGIRSGIAIGYRF